ncbi:MAG: GPW/gp25 family protein [Gammaproteobacteria bacterium]
MTIKAWRFNHPDFDYGAANSGLAVTATGAIAMVEGDRAIRQSILLLLSTMPGERINRPGYGCDLHKLVFMPNDATTHGLAIHYVRQAIGRWERRVRIVRLDANANPEDAARMDILLNYQVLQSAFNDELSMSLTLSELES